VRDQLCRINCEPILRTTVRCLELLECSHEHLEELREGISCTFHSGAASDLAFWRYSAGTQLRGEAAGELCSHGKEIVVGVGHAKET
jgi:hypothetical protein